jgi:hypothetical protein
MCPFSERLAVAELNESGTGPQIDVKQTTAYRGLRAAVIILGVLIVLALGILVVGLFIKLGGHKPPGDAPDAYVAPPDAKLLSTEVSNDRLILHLRTGASDEIDIVDTQSGRLVARLKFPPAKP